VTSTNSSTAAGSARPRPPFWLKLSVLAGNLIQLAGIVAGLLLIVLAAGISVVPVASAAFAVVGIVLVAFSSHSIGHWLVGRLVGIRFAYIGVRGTDHPETYPPPIRQMFSSVPMFTMVSTRRSRLAAGRWALAAYFAAGQTTAVVGWVLSAALARLLNVPAARFIFLVVIAWAVGTVLVAVFSPKGDYAKARVVLGAGSVA